MQIAELLGELQKFNGKLPHGLRVIIDEAAVDFLVMTSFPDKEFAGKKIGRSFSIKKVLQNGDLFGVSYWHPPHAAIIRHEKKEGFVVQAVIEKPFYDSRSDNELCTALLRQINLESEHCAAD